MYRCCVNFYLMGWGPETAALLKGIPPLEHFSHTFTASPRPEASLAAQADVILADLQAMDAAEALQALTAAQKEGAQLIAVAGGGQLAQLSPFLPRLRDVWTAPLTEEVLAFRFQRWQEIYKQSTDLWQTGQFLDAVINGAPNLVWFKDKNGIHEKVNDSFCKAVNKTHEQIRGRGHAYIWDVEQDDPACIESERVVMETGQTHVSEELIQTGGGPRLLATYKSPLYDWDGSVMGTVGTAIDITQERAYEREIVQQNNTLEAIFTSLDCGIICHSLDGSRIISVNQAALSILGYRSQEEMTRNGFFLVAASVVEEDRGALQKLITGLKKPGDSASAEYRVRHPDGRVLHIMGNMKLVEENGQRFIQRFLLDRTTQKLKEQQERVESERRQMELVQALSVDYSLVCVFDLATGEGRALRAGDCSESILKSLFSGELQLERCIGSYISSCVYEEDREEVLAACRREYLEEKLSADVTAYLNYRTMCCGEMRYFQMKVVRTGDWSKGPHTIVLGLRNVDEETRQELEKKTALEDALEQANQASKAKSIFLSNMSHDIRTPMNAIVGFTSLAITHMDQKEQVEGYLKKILTSGNHLVSLINDVLDMSRIESGKMRLEEALCSLPELLHGLRSIVQADIRAKQLDFFIDTVDVLDEEVYCDKLRLNQVLLNLLSNAIKYTPAGGVVSMRIMEKPGAPAGCANYEFHVKDNGIGMSPDFVAHIFEPFERERNSTISGIQGTGLGMAITKNIVDMMDGSIQVHSEQGVGSEFTVSFTFRLLAGPKEIPRIPELQDCRALVVDDDFDTCDSVSHMLQQFGMRAEWTLSGKEAVLRTRQAVMRGDAYRVYIIDWLIPDLNGIEVARRIRKETGDDVPIIVLTAYDVSDIEEEARDAGVTAFCSKPLFMSELRSCLHCVVNTGREAPEQAAPEQAERHTGRILLAEDNELNQEIAIAILTEAGFTVEVAANGQLAVDMLRAAQPGYYHLILMDVQMPVMDGYAATQAIRSLEDQRLASIPILAMTANAFEEDRRQALNAGMNGHIAKPIDIKKLLDTLGQIMDQ